MEITYDLAKGADYTSVSVYDTKEKKFISTSTYGAGEEINWEIIKEQCEKENTK